MSAPTKVTAADFDQVVLKSSTPVLVDSGLNGAGLAAQLLQFSMTLQLNTATSSRL